MKYIVEFWPGIWVGGRVLGSKGALCLESATA